MGTVYIFRGKAAAGKTTLSNMLARKLSIPVFRKDDIVDALKMTVNIDTGIISNEVCYNILYRMIQANLDLGADFILDIALGDRHNAEAFFNRLDFGDRKIVRFFIDCCDENEWKRRHMERLKNPLPHQSFQSLKHVIEHYRNADVNPFDDESIINSTGPLEKSFEAIIKIIDSLKQNVGPGRIAQDGSRG